MEAVGEEWSIPTVGPGFGPLNQNGWRQAITDRALVP